RDYCRMLGASLLSSMVLISLCALPLSKVAPFRIGVIAALITSMEIVSLRMGIRAIRRLISIFNGSDFQEEPKRILIVGAGNLGVTLARDILSNEALNYKIIGFVDDDERKKHTMIMDAEVLGGTEKIPALYERYRPDEIIFAISTASPEEKKRILSLCAETHCSLKTVSGFADTLEGRKSTEFLRRVEVEDLLGREMVSLDDSAIEEDLRDKVVMVTGGGGSIGSELCRQIMAYSPKKLVIVDIYENNAFDLQNELAEMFPDADIRVVIASVRDEERLEKVFEEFKPSIVFHAAAHKHVPMMEFNAMEAVKNNVFGTWNTAQCASRAGVERFILISTDKAVNPTNVMGATKRICEMIVQAMQTVSETEFAAVRFGNVLDSNGSVLPRFKKQLLKGGPLTVTHPEITRFFMTIPEAAQLVLQAATFAKGGEIFVLDMGKPVRIYDLAKNLIRLSGLRLGRDIDIVFTGLRPGEKLYEELLMDEEGLQKTAHNKIHIGKPFFHSMDELQEKLDILRNAIKTQDNEVVKRAVAKVVPTYQKPTIYPEISFTKVEDVDFSKEEVQKV
ncbi:MAG: polysaccharide biosynthesis protein, partial [Clostridia bacterium]|nr:polysaccharide biosynthesis protein [Clostridia bacterium]